MLTRILSIFLFLTLTLFGAPNIDQFKAAVMSDPTLLDTPQAKAMMKEKGITKADIESKLHKSNKMADEVISTDSIENNIVFLDNNETNSTNSELLDINTTIHDVDNENLTKRLNPFEYKTDAELRKELNEKKQLLSSQKLSRYSDSFYANKNMIDSASLPTPDDYTIATGDKINIHIYGDRDKNYELSVSNDGEIDIEYIGPVRVGGLSFSFLKESLSKKLKHHFKQSSFKISISKYSSIQVTLIGDVKYPGIYNLSSFSSAKDLLIASIGIRENASVRDIEIKRAGKTIAHIDFYDLLFGAKSIGGTLLKHGDIVLVKKAKVLVSIDGFVNHAAIFELQKGETLSSLVEYAGGMKSSASKRHIKIERYSQNSISETFHIPYKRAKNFRMQDGDKVYIYMLDSSTSSSVNVYGNIIRPGAYRIGSKNTLNAFFKENLQFGIKNFFLPETYFEYGMIKRYGENLEYETHSFHLKDVIDGKERVVLQAQDEIFIFSKNDVQSSAFVTTKGSVLLSAGKLRYIVGMTIRDAINAAGVDGIVDDRVKVTTINTPNRMPQTEFYSYIKDANKVLSPYDELEVYDYYETHLLQPVSIKGEIVNPTTVFYEKGMNLQKLLDAGGGLTIEAYLKKLEVVRYFIDENSNRKKKVIILDLASVDKSAFSLEPYDEITVYKIPNWGDKRVVSLKGEVKFPGKYTVSNGEKLSSVIQRAGGFTDEAFVEGAVFTRDSIRKRQISQYNQSLSRIKRELALYNAMPANAKVAAVGANSINSLNEVMLEAQKYQPIGRVSIVLQKDVEELKKSEFDLILKDKDEITVPNQIDTVTVFGEVFNPTSFVYNEDLSAQEYIAMASGLSRSADGDSIYVIHANGTSEPLDNGWFSGSVKIAKGDTIIVPLYIKEYNTLEVWNSVAKVLSSFAVTAAALTTLGVFQ